MREKKQNRFDSRNPLRRPFDVAKKIPLEKQARFDERLLSFLLENLPQPYFFGKLEKVADRDLVRVFLFEGVPVVIKKAWSFDLLTKADKNRHGLDFNELRRAFLAHHLSLRKGEIKAEHYILRSAKVYGVVGHFLAMRFIKGKSIKEISASLKNQEEVSAFDKAVDEIRGNFFALAEKSLIGRSPQIDDLIVAGNTNPAQPQKGKWIFYLPYDYG